MRVNIYAEEMTGRIEIIEKEIDGNIFEALRFYLYLPVTKEIVEDTHVGATKRTVQVQGPFLHRDDDDDSSAVTFWSRGQLRTILQQAIELLDKHHANKSHTMTTIECEDMLRKQREGWVKSELQWAKDFREGKCERD